MDRACEMPHIPYPTGRFFGVAIPRHFVPGYDRYVPPGHLAKARLGPSARAIDRDKFCLSLRHSGLTMTSTVKGLA
jgi:hypothetical protein